MEPQLSRIRMFLLPGKAVGRTGDVYKHNPDVYTGQGSQWHRQWLSGPPNDAVSEIRRGWHRIIPSLKYTIWSKPRVELLLIQATLAYQISTLSPMVGGLSLPNKIPKYWCRGGADRTIGPGVFGDVNLLLRTQTSRYFEGMIEPNPRVFQTPSKRD